MVIGFIKCNGKIVECLNLFQGILICKFYCGSGQVYFVVCNSTEINLLISIHVIVIDTLFYVDQLSHWSWLDTCIYLVLHGVLAASLASCSDVVSINASLL